MNIQTKECNVLPGSNRIKCSFDALGDRGVSTKSYRSGANPSRLGGGAVVQHKTVIQTASPGAPTGSIDHPGEDDPRRVNPGSSGSNGKKPRGRTSRFGKPGDAKGRSITANPHSADSSAFLRSETGGGPSGTPLGTVLNPAGSKVAQIDEVRATAASYYRTATKPNNKTQMSKLGGRSTRPVVAAGTGALRSQTAAPHSVDESAGLRYGQKGVPADQTGAPQRPIPSREIRADLSQGLHLRKRHLIGSRASLRIFQLNIQGIGPKAAELAKVLNERKVHVALLQECRFGAKKNNSRVAGYTIHKCKCSDCQGIAILARNDLTLQNLEHQKHGGTDVLTVQMIFNGQSFTIFNVYNSPKYPLDLRLPTGPNYVRTIVAGDFNGRSPRWGYTDRNTTGKTLESLEDESNLVRLQSAETPPTLLHCRHGTESRPDLSFLSADLEGSMTVLDDLGSDHLPILLSIGAQKVAPAPPRPVWKWRYGKADWKRYEEITDRELGQMELAGDVNGDYTRITKAILKAAEMSIPRGGPARYSPFWNERIDVAVKKRQRARRRAAANPTAANRTNYNRLSAEAKLLIREEKRRRWSEKCESLNLAEDARGAWRLLDNLRGVDRERNPAPLRAEQGGLTTSDKMKAGVLNRHFARVNKSGPLDWRHKQERKERERNVPAVVEPGFERELTLLELDAALNRVKKYKAPGPDRVSNEMLINLGQLAKKKLLEYFNFTWREGKLPEAWKIATITPIPKKGKDPELAESYRPISLTSCVGKLAERIINGRLYDFLERRGILSENQAGFRRGRQTVDQILYFLQDVSDNLRKRVHTAAVFVDFQQAYDRVWRSGLLLKLLKMGVSGAMYSWLKGFLTDRKIQTLVNGKFSTKLPLSEGLPQGSSLSCTLFLAFINDISEHMSGKVAMFADDMVIWQSDKDLKKVEVGLQDACERLGTYCQRWRMRLNTAKTVYSVFSLSPRVLKEQLHIPCGDRCLSKESNPTYLGVKLDPGLTLRIHAQELADRAAQRLVILKKLASTNWGARLSTLRQLYIGHIRALMEYALPVAGFIKPTNLEPLIRVQNQALRFICGGMRTTPTSACEVMAGVEPFSLRRDCAILSTLERYRRYPRGDRRRETVETWKDSGKMKRSCFLREANRLREGTELSDLPAAETLGVPELPPHVAPRQPVIRPLLLAKSAHKGLDPLVLKSMALETIEAYPRDAIRAYTDGSRIDSSAGYGVLIEFPGSPTETEEGYCGRYRSNYDAEAAGIFRAVKRVTARLERAPPGQRQPDQMVVFTDARSVLDALKNWSAALIHPVLGGVARATGELQERFGVRVTLQWIPSHCGVPGNDSADSLAKSGVSTGRSHSEARNDPGTESITVGLRGIDQGLSVEASRQICREAMKCEWLRQWETGATGRSVHRYMPGPVKNDPWRFLTRRDQTVIFGLRTGHIPLGAHLNRINPLKDPSCRHCGAPSESVEHVLITCPRLRVQRAQWLPTPSTIENCLYSGREQLGRTASFYRSVV